MISIKLNEPQPAECPKCKSYEGYQYSDYMKVHYTSQHDAEGKYEGGEYSHGRIINEAVSTFCCNCGTRLPFKLVREN